MKKVFEDFRTAVQKQFVEMKESKLFRTTPGKDILWHTYLSSFPEGTNPIYRERTEFDCQCCKNFIRTVGDAVTISDSGEVTSIWDVDVGGHFQVVADALSACVKASQVSDMFLHFEPTVGVSETHQQLEGGEVKVWSHFFLDLPSAAVLRKDAIPTKLGKVRSTRDVFARSLMEISVEALETVLELVDQNSLYRGQENRFAVAEFLKFKKEFLKLEDSKAELYSWAQTGLPLSVATMRNTAIGTLLVDLSEDKDLDVAVRSFEAKVAPANYKRPTALITKTMIKKAQQTVEDLGFLTALDRRYAVVDDVTVNNVLFADRIAKQEMNVFDELAGSISENVQSLDKVEAVDVETFVTQVLPGSTSVELLLENRHARSLVSLVAPVHSDAKCMFKWDNRFSWAYAGELTDSIKARVKNAGGNIEGDLRCSLSWFNTDDLDLHMVEPDGQHICYSSKYSKTGNLDVDMNVGAPLLRDAVENITYQDRHTMQEGAYKLYVNNYTKRESVDVGFEVEVEFDGVIHTFSYDKAVRQKGNVVVAEFKFSRKDGIAFTKSLPSSQASKKIWGLPTQSFHRVSMVMNSPNHWDGRGTGNKHYFFMLQDCLNADKARGFFNEFLSDDLREHRKVFEVLGSKMKAEESGTQLSGLGFSSTQRNHVLCRVTGSFSRVIKLTF